MRREYLCTSKSGEICKRYALEIPPFAGAETPKQKVCPSTEIWVWILLMVCEGPDPSGLTREETEGHSAARLADAMP